MKHARQVHERSEAMAEATSLLGITRKHLYRQMERYGLEPHRMVPWEGEFLDAHQQQAENFHGKESTP